MRTIGSPYVDNGKQQAFLKKKTLCQKIYGIAQPKQKPAKNIEKVGCKTLD
jgi:hypothetical protein